MSDRSPDDPARAGRRAGGRDERAPQALSCREGRNGSHPATVVIRTDFAVGYHFFSTHFLDILRNNEARKRPIIRDRLNQLHTALKHAQDDWDVISAFARGDAIAHRMMKMLRQSQAKCHIISEDPFVERGIISVLISAGYEVCGSVDCDDGSICDIVLLCTDQHNRASHTEFCASLPEQCKLVILAQSHDGDALPSQVLACAAAVLDRGVSQQKLLVTLDAVMMGAVVRDAPFFRPSWEQRDIRLPASLPRPPAQIPPAKPGSEILACPFSIREQEILSVLAEGVSNKHIARKFDIAESTVKVHVKHILRKLNMNNRTQAAIWAKSYGPIPA